MARRHRNKHDPPESVDWREYSPTTAQYWRYGGPWIAPDDVPPHRHDPDGIGGFLKGDARRRFVGNTTAVAAFDLGRSMRRYIALHEHGTEALEDRIKERWRHAVHTGSNQLTDPDPVSVQLAACYRDIRDARGLIAAGEQALVDVDRATFPLLHWQD